MAQQNYQCLQQMDINNLFQNLQTNNIIQTQTPESSLYYHSLLQSQATGLSNATD